MSEVELYTLPTGDHFLYIDHELWMWDTEFERNDQKKIANIAYGNVLVAGYGLGLVQQYLTENPKVDNVTTIEREPDVLRLCEVHYGQLYGEIFVEDFYEPTGIMLKGLFDCVVGDIWRDTTHECLRDYIKFKEQARRHLKTHGTIIAWGQELFEMWISGKF